MQQSVAEVKKINKFSTGDLFFNNTLQTVKDRPTVSSKVVNRYYIILVKPSAGIISTVFLNNQV